MIYLKRKYQSGSTIGSDSPPTVEIPKEKENKSLMGGEKGGASVTQKAVGAFGPWGQAISAVSQAGTSTLYNTTKRDQFGIAQNETADGVKQGVAVGVFNPSQNLNALGDKRFSNGEKALSILTPFAYGFIKAKKDNEDAKKRRKEFYDQLSKNSIAQSNKTAGLANETAQRMRDLTPSNYKMTSAKNGGKLYPSFKNGGTTPHAVIPKGTLHSEKNNIGSKGLPVIAKDGTKVAEIERDEIIFTKDQTIQMQDLAKQYSSTKDESILVKLGELVGSFVATSKDMKDVS